MVPVIVSVVMHVIGTLDVRAMRHHEDMLAGAHDFDLGGGEAVEGRVGGVEAVSHGGSFARPGARRYWAWVVGRAPP